ncbi:hypothetical protein Bca52824_006348 [Brassica carinata]|uniref:Uncharacterized protein n=1 Tax=Brassica carinata TaxID=52824 RepID=A0A8X8BHN5_BRACI|nr:hypothetical protein Bca52824_006348 [Brassica carinata]
MSMLSQNVPRSKVRREECDDEIRGKRRKMEEKQSNESLNRARLVIDGDPSDDGGADDDILVIDGKRNTKIPSIFLEDCPIRKAAFFPNGSQVIVSGKRKFFYRFYLENARFDKIGPLVGREDNSLVHLEASQDLKIIALVGNEVRSLAFSDDEKQLLSSGGNGQMYGNEVLIQSLSLWEAKRKPIKTVDNLTSRIDFMKFNHDAQILAIVHVLSLTVFSSSAVQTASLQECLKWP